MTNGTQIVFLLIFLEWYVVPLRKCYCHCHLRTEKFKKHTSRFGIKWCSQSYNICIDCKYMSVCMTKEVKFNCRSENVWWENDLNINVYATVKFITHHLTLFFYFGLMNASFVTLPFRANSFVNNFTIQMSRITEVTNKIDYSSNHELSAWFM